MIRKKASRAIKPLAPVNRNSSLRRRCTFQAKEIDIQHYFWNDHFGWGWLLWCGVLILLFSSFENRRHSYAARRKQGVLLSKEKLDTLNERHASVKITRERFDQMKLDMAKA